MSADFEYDAAGRLSAIVRNTIGATKLRTNLRYDAGGNMTRMITCRLASGTDCIAAVDGAQPLDSVPQDIRYVFDASGNIRIKTQQLWQANDATVKAWAASTQYTVGDVVNPSIANKHQYVVVTAGRSATAEPAWPTTEGATVTDGGVTLRETTTITTYAYDAQERLILEDRPDDPATQQDYTRRYIYDAYGRLDRIENAECTTGDNVAEQYTYANSSAKSQPASINKWKFTVASGACTRTPWTDTDIEFGTAASGQEGAITEIATHDYLAPTESEVWEYGFDEENLLELAQYVDHGVTVTSRDAEGRPLSATDGTDTIQFGFVADERVPSMLAESGDEEARGQLYAPNGWLIAENRDPAGLSRYYIVDHLGSPIAEFDRGGVERGSREYDSFGQEADLQSSGEMSTTFGFTGERQDPTSGLTDHDARSYNADLRMFVNTDQYTEPADDLELALDPVNASRMQYVGGNPVNYVDDTGHYIDHGGGRTSMRMANGTFRTNVRANGNSKLSYSYVSSGRPSAAVARAQQARNTAATKARWNARPEVKAMKAKVAAREAKRARVLIRRVSQMAAAQKEARQAVKLYKELAGEPRLIQRAYTSGVVGSICAGGAAMAIGIGAGGNSCLDIGWNRSGPTRPALRASVNGSIGVGAHFSAGASGGITTGTSNPGDLEGASRRMWTAGAWGPGAEVSYSPSTVCGNASHSVSGGPTWGFGGGAAATFQHSWGTSEPSRCA